MIKHKSVYYCDICSTKTGVLVQINPRTEWLCPECVAACKFKMEKGGSER
jgi:hypothetical protein